LLPNGVYANSGGSSPILVDVANDATYFVDLYSLRVYDRDRFTLRRTVALPYPVYGARSGAVWGVGRVVFTTQMNTLMVVDLGVDLADTDADGIVDAADNCPAASNKPQLDTDGDGAGDACDAQPLVPSGSPIACGAETLRANVAIAASSADIAQCVAAGFPDGDADGEPDATDRCAGTPEGASRDAAGCSQAQFCTAAGLARCTRGDFRNDEPASKKPADCAVAAGSCAAR
jgi:hypothetical protein